MNEAYGVLFNFVKVLFILKLIRNVPTSSWKLNNGKHNAEVPLESLTYYLLGWSNRTNCKGYFDENKIIRQRL
jgi:hypothetical protein